MYYINRFGQGQRETVSEAATKKVAKHDCWQFAISDPSARHWVSTRPCKGWAEPKPPKPAWFVEITDTFGGEANYCWVRRFKVRAVSERGAMRVVQNNWGGNWRANVAGRFDQVGACVCAFVMVFDEDSHSKIHLENLTGE